MTEDDNLLEDFLKKVKDLVTKEQGINANPKESFNPNEFLKSRNCALYKRFFQESMNLDPNQVISFFLKHIKNAIHSISSSNANQENVNFMSTMFALLRNSFDFYTEKNDILNEQQHLVFIKIGLEILKAENYDKDLKKNFLLLINSSSRKSPSQVVTFIYELDKYAEQQTLAKSIEWLFKMILFSISDIEALEIMISNIHTIEDANSQYIPNIMELIQASYKQIIFENPESYSNFYHENKDNQNIVYLYSQIDSWGKLEDLPIKTVLYLLQPSQLDVSIFEGSALYQTFLKLNTAQEPLLSKILDALKIIFETYLYTNIKDSICIFVTKINNLLLNYYADNHSNLSKTSVDFFATIYPVCLLFLSPDSFENKYLPILQKEEDYAQRLIQIIITVGPFIKQNKQEFYEVFGQLFLPINDLIQNNDKEVSTILQNIKNFKYLYRFFIYENTFTFHKIIENGMSIYYYDLFYSESFYTMPVEPPFWTISKYITDLMIKLLEKKFSNYLPNQKLISPEFSRFHQSIINFIQLVISNQNCDYSKDELASILYNFEAIAYSTLSTNTKVDRSNCLATLTSIYMIIQKLKLQIDIPGDNIYSFGAVCKTYHDACKQFALINKKYLINQNEGQCPKIPKGWELTISILFPRFEKMTRTLLNRWSKPSQSYSNDQTENNQNQEQNQQHQELDELKSCIYVLFPLIRESTPSLEELIYLILENNGQVGHECSKIMATSLSPSTYYNIFQLINTNFSKLVKKINEANKSQVEFIENSINFMKILVEYQVLTPNPNYSTIFTRIIDNSSLLCKHLNTPSLDNLFCTFIISLMALTERVSFEINISSRVRNQIGKMIVSWINRIQTPEKDKTFELYYLALYSILDGINFQECKSNEVLAQKSIPFEYFSYYYSRRIISETLISISIPAPNIRKTNLLLYNGNKVISCDYNMQQNERNKNQFTLSILNPILKNNFDLCINHTMSLAFDPKIKLRTAFLNALSSALTPETYQQFVNPVINRTVADLIFENNLGILKLLAIESPYKAGEIAEAIVKASALKKIEMQVFEELAKIEIQNNNDPTRNTLFRGNGLTSHAISYFPKYFAMDWANDLIQPLLLLDNSNLKFFWNALILKIEEMFATMPGRMKQAIRILFNLLAPESTEIAFSMLSGFVFLRFLCPMLAKNEKFVKESSLLMSASIRPTISDNKTQFLSMKSEVADAYNRIQKLFQNIVCYPLYMQNGADYKPPPIEIKPINPPLDADDIISDLISALWSQMTFIQKMFHQTPDDVPIHATLDQLIAKLKEAGKPHRKIKPLSISEVLNHGNMLNPQLEEFLQTNQEYDPSLEKWFYLAPLISRDGSFIFMMNMSEIKQPFTAQQLCAYMFSQIISIGDAKYSVFVEFADFDVELLPSLNQIKKTVKLATNEMVSRLVNVYVGRVQENAVSYLYKASKLLKKIPLKLVADYKMILDEIGELKLSEITSEFFSTPEASYQLQEKSNYPVIRLHKKSIQIVDKFEINQTEFFTSKHCLLSTIESIGPSQTSKTTSSFTIRTKSGKPFDIQSPSSIQLRNAISQLFHRFHNEKHENKLCVDRSSFASLILIISFINMLSDNGDQELKASALNLYNTIIDSSGLKTTVEKEYFSKDEVPFSMLQMVETLSKDLASSNPNEVHSFFLEFTKVISFLDQRDYANSERFLQPWLYYAPEIAINNQTTLDCLAQISTQAPKKCFIQFNKGMWQNFTRIDLIDQLFDKFCNFNESCFGSVFLLIAVKYSSDITRIFVEKLKDFATDLTQRQFALVAEILNSLIVGKLFDYSYKAILLHQLALFRLLGLSSLIKPCFIIFQSITNNSTDVNFFTCTQSSLSFINDDVNNNIKNEDGISTASNNINTTVNQRVDYRPFLFDTAKMALLYREHYSKELFNLFMKDSESLLNSNSSSLTDSNTQSDFKQKLNGIIFTSALENNYSIALEVYKSFYNFNPFKTLATCSMALSLVIDLIPKNSLSSIFFTAFAAIFYTKQTTPFDLIYSILRVNRMNFNDIIRNTQPRSLELLDNLTNISFSTQPLLSFLLTILYFYSCGKIELPNIICQQIPDQSKNSLEKSILLILRFSFNESLENEISLMLSKSSEKDIANITAIITLLYLWNSSDHIKHLFTKLLDSHPEYFTNIDFASIYSRNANQFKSVDTKSLILLSKATRMASSINQKSPVQKYHLHPVIESIFSGKEIFLITLEQAKSIFHSFFSS